MKILAFSGSNSSRSINQQLIKLGCKYLNVPFDIIDLTGYDIPMFSEDQERENGFPADLNSLYDTFKRYDAYIISIPEHNGNFPAFFKNILDWLSRIYRWFFSGKPILLLNATPGLNSGGSVVSLAKVSFAYFGGKVIGSKSIKRFGLAEEKEEIKANDRATTSLIKSTIEEFENRLEESVK